MEVYPIVQNGPLPVEITPAMDTMGLAVVVILAVMLLLLVLTRD